MKKHIYFSILLFVLMLLSACTLVAWEPDSMERQLASQEIPVDGGTITIEDSELSGLRLHIPRSSYDERVNFTISLTDFRPSEETDLFNPITPLIVIDNGHTFSRNLLELSIPINIDQETEFAMAFFYDEETEEFEAIPTLSSTNEELVVATSHFSKIIVSKVTISDLLEDVLFNPNSYDSGFVPGVDDWQFDNYGSEHAVGGHCAGQVATMNWYYKEMKQKLGSPSLYQLYNGGTPNFWLDDSDPYRFASVVQERLDLDHITNEIYKQVNQEDKEKFLAFAYALKTTRNPQFLGIYSTDSSGLANGHAISVTKLIFNVNRFELSVVDPNFSGVSNRMFTYSEALGFGSYSSGANANETDSSENTIYTEFIFLAETALVNYDLIASEYENMLDGTVGDDVFTTYTYEYLSAADEDGLVWSPLTENLDYVGFEYANLKSNQIVIRVSSNLDNYITVFRENGSSGNRFQIGETGYVSIVVPLYQGTNEISLFSERLIRESYGASSVDVYYYSDYQSFTIHSEEPDPTETDPPEEEPETFTYSVFYKSAIEDSVEIWSPCPDTLTLDYSYGSMTRQVAFDTKVITFKIESDDDAYSVRLLNRIGSVIGTEGEDGEWYVSDFISGGETYVLTVQIYKTVNNQRTLVESIEITIETTW